jgi:hypothetical protein
MEKDRHLAELLVHDRVVWVGFTTVMQQEYGRLHSRWRKGYSRSRGGVHEKLTLFQLRGVTATRSTNFIRRIHMKKLAFIGGLCLTLGSAVLSAQEMVALHANIPFDFWVGNKLAPAGDYLIQTWDGKTVFREEGGRLVASWLLGIPESRVTAPERGELIFHRYGGDYFLTTVWTPDSKLGYSIPMTSREKAVAGRAGGGPETASIRAK